MEKTSSKRGIGIIAVIHDLNAVLRYADEVILLDNGNICSSGKPQDVINHDHVASSFCVEAAFTESQGVPFMIPLHSLG
jgi:iron complex transport system ATP-binding protein